MVIRDVAREGFCFELGGSESGGRFIRMFDPLSYDVIHHHTNKQISTLLEFALESKTKKLPIFFIDERGGVAWRGAGLLPAYHFSTYGG